MCVLSVFNFVIKTLHEFEQFVQSKHWMLEAEYLIIGTGSATKKYSCNFLLQLFDDLDYAELIKCWLREIELLVRFDKFAL